MIRKKIIGIVFTFSIMSVFIGCKNLAQIQQPADHVFLQGTETDEDNYSLLKRADYRIDQQTSGKACIGGENALEVETKLNDKTLEIAVLNRVISLSKSYDIQALTEGQRQIDRALYMSGQISTWDFVKRSFWLPYRVSKSVFLDNIKSLGFNEGYLPTILHLSALYDAMSKVDKHAYLVAPRFETEKHGLFGSNCVRVKARVIVLENGPVATR